MIFPNNLSKGAFFLFCSYQVGPPKPATLLSRIGVQVFPVVRCGVLGVFLLPILDVAHHHQRRASDENELQGPQADVRDGEDAVVAHVGAARLGRVADKVLAVVAPHPLSRNHKHHHAENEDHGQPDASEHGGVLVDPAEQGLQCRPVHACCPCSQVEELKELFG